MATRSILPPCGMLLVLILVSLSWVGRVESMVAVAPSARKGSTTTPAVENTDSGELLRMLLQSNKNNNNGRIKSPSSYSIGDAPTTTTTTISSNSKSNSKGKTRTSPLLDQWRDYEALRPTNFEDEVLRPFFFESGWERKQIIANRFVQVISTLTTARDDWNQSQEAKKAANPLAEKDDDVEVSLKAPTGDDPAAIRLCAAVASLGPLAVKLGQTLSQRPDIVGKDACNALKRLQTQNTPFADTLAYAVIRESLDYWDGPLAENLDDGHNNNNKKPLFRSISPEPIASASLGQVYKATTWEGVDIALKVQRPDALSVIAIDTQCFRIASDVRNKLIDLGEQWNSIRGIGNGPSDGVEHTPETGMTEDEVRARGDEGTVASVIDRVAKDIKREMDYRIEASNAYKFRDSLSFLGFVDTPDVLLATDKVLATRFVNGHHLDALEDPSDELALTRMAVEACTASMVLTGFVHADPHEGNLMLREDDGRIVFLDFGLMSDVDQNIMEAFARGIQSLLSEDFVSVTEAFSDTGFITTPIMHRNGIEDLWRVDPDHGLQELASELEYAMKTTEGGLSRFGALATVLNKKISPNWLVFTPPYVLLIIRTFLTLEGIAAQVDPDFNIYEMSLPWVVRRSLSPSTKKGQKVLRDTILKKDNTIQWGRIMELMEMQKAAAAAASEAKAEAATETTAEAEDSSSAAASVPPPAAAQQAAATKTASQQREETARAIAAARTPEEKARKQQEYAAARQGAMKDAIGTLLGSTNGRALRGVLRDLDTPDLVWKLGSREGRPIVRMGTEKALNTMLSSLPFLSGGKRRIQKETTATTVERSSNNAATASGSKHREIENYRPVSEACVALRSKQARRTKTVTRFLARLHLRRCLSQVRGVVGLARLAVTTLQIAASLLLRKTIRRLTKTATISTTATTTTTA